MTTAISGSTVWGRETIILSVKIEIATIDQTKGIPRSGPVAF
jgi:hypothetical protein